MVRQRFKQTNQVSVRTLHHYDNSGLLKPSIRLANGYRLYSEKDLLRLQQIIALKFFGFTLSQIKVLLQQEVNIVAHLRTQVTFLEKKADSLREASKTLAQAIADSQQHKSVPWKTVIHLIEVYRMTQQLQQSWASQILSEAELKQFAELKMRQSAQEEKNYQQHWAMLVQEVQNHLDQSPASASGKRLAGRWMNLVNSAFGKQDYELRNKIWNAHKAGKIADSSVPHNVVLWLDQAISAFYQERWENLMADIHQHLHENPATPKAQALAKAWFDLIDEMYGNDDKARHAFYQAYASAPNSPLTKEVQAWLEAAINA